MNHSNHRPKGDTFTVRRTYQCVYRVMARRSGSSEVMELYRSIHHKLTDAMHLDYEFSFGNGWEIWKDRIITATEGEQQEGNHHVAMGSGSAR